MSTGKKIVLWAVLIVIGLPVLAGVVFGFLNFFLATPTRAKDPCYNNLRQLDGAKEQWSLESKATNGANVNTNGVLSYLRENRMPVCPEGGTYSLGRIGENPRCSIKGHSL